MAKNDENFHCWFSIHFRANFPQLGPSNLLPVKTAAENQRQIFNWLDTLHMSINSVKAMNTSIKCVTSDIFGSMQQNDYSCARALDLFNPQKRKVLFLLFYALA